MILVWYSTQVNEIVKSSELQSDPFSLLIISLCHNIFGNNYPQMLTENNKILAISEVKTMIELIIYFIILYKILMKNIDFYCMTEFIFYHLFMADEWHEERAETTKRLRFLFLQFGIVHLHTNL